MRENQPKDFADENDKDPEKFDLGPDDSLPKPSKYDPSIDYYDLVWKAYYEKHKGEPFAESAKRLIEL
ncbi:hypothetical protein RclHR1_20820002 [Rhizophagus clarus]|uniref:Uncharacterized protein n=1 Tax=Rhizophagus clarus TaxID=94130 RepID=A0A2Z6R4L2_9GLOM|nr:hypothetical protein RclHR1_20820002 [Rhizophagus clarus]GES97320.1 hypothetical protein GLOIN_2v1789072 [Rhizophagus clarus]